MVPDKGFFHVNANLSVVYMQNVYWLEYVTVSKESQCAL